MAVPETVGRGECGYCHGSVAIKKNKDNRPYYLCDHCGFKGEHMWRRTSDKVLQQFAVPADHAAIREKAGNSGAEEGGAPPEKPKPEARPKSALEQHLESMRGGVHAG